MGKTNAAEFMSLVSLPDATTLGQPVEGTSAGSRYTLVAKGLILNVAARVTANNTVSIRVAPKPAHLDVFLTEASKIAFGELGIPIHQTGGYASVHSGASNAQQAVMGIAAYLAGLSMLYPDLEVMPYRELPTLIGKGA